MAYVDIQNGDDSDDILLKLNKGLALADKSVTSVDTMQELCDLPTDLHLNATISGFHSAEGGGGGPFYWDASRSKTEHNGGTIVDPLKGDQLGEAWPGTWFTPNVSGVGCWVKTISPVAINLNKYNVRAEQWGVKCNGSADDAQHNSTAFESIFSYLYEAGGGKITLPSNGYCKILSPIPGMDNVCFDLNNNVIENVRETSLVYGDTSIVQPGRWTRQSSSEFNWKKTGAISYGDFSITLLSAGDGPLFNVGDPIAIVKADSGFGQAGIQYPAYALFAKITNISSGVLELDRPIDCDIDAGSGTQGATMEGAWVTNASYSYNEALGTYYIVSDFEFVNGTIVSKGRRWMSQTGMLDSLFEKLNIIGSPNIVYGNGFGSSRFHDIKGSFYERAFEIKYTSHNSKFSDIRAVFRDFGTYTVDTQISIGEISRNVVLDDVILDFNGMVTSDNLISVQNNGGHDLKNSIFRNGQALNLFGITGANNAFSNLKFIDTSVTTDGGALIELSEGSADNKFYEIDCEKVLCTDASYVVRFSADSQRNSVNRSFFPHTNLGIKDNGGTLNSVTGCSGVGYISTASNTFGASSNSTLQREAAKRELHASLATAYTESLSRFVLWEKSIAEGAIFSSDILEIIATGYCGSAGGVKTIEMSAQVTGASEQSILTFTLTGTQNFRAHARLMYSSSTTTRIDYIVHEPDSLAVIASGQPSLGACGVGAECTFRLYANVDTGGHRVTLVSVVGKLTGIGR